MRAASLAVIRELGAPTGPEIEPAIDMEAMRALCSGLDLLAALQCEGDDTVAEGYGYATAADMLSFLATGPETARSPQ